MHHGRWFAKPHKRVTCPRHVFQVTSLSESQEAKAELEKQLKQAQNSVTDTAAQLSKVRPPPTEQGETTA